MVIIIPGILNRPNFYKPTVEKLQKQGLSASIIDLGSNWQSIEEASELMAVHHIRRLVVTEKSEVVGIITSRDLVDTLRYSLSKSIKDLGITNYRPDYSRDIAKNTNN